jgi:hypothetical protein
MARAGKGSAFEREICKKLSLWWTNNKTDDVFWRASNSGGRAKFRGRKGQSTHGQHGDIAAVDPIGEPLINLFTIELKRGYSSVTPFDLLDRSSRASTQMFEKWWNQVWESHKMSGSTSLMMITKRDRREAMIYLPYRFVVDHMWRLRNSAFPSVFIRLRDNRDQMPSVFGTTLDQFLLHILPKDIKGIAKQ